MEKLESILGIDLGEKRVGLAMAKSGIAFEYKTINFNNLSELIEQIVKICQDEKIEKIILGVAKNREAGFRETKGKPFNRKKAFWIKRN